MSASEGKEKKAECKQRGSSMTARIKTGQSRREPNSTSTLFFDEDLVSIPPASVPDEFRKLSRFLPVVVLIPKSAVCEKAARNEFASSKPVTLLNGDPHISPVDAAAWFENPSAADRFVFGELTVRFSAM